MKMMKSVVRHKREYFQKISNGKIQTYALHLKHEKLEIITKYFIFFDFEGLLKRLHIYLTDDIMIHVHALLTQNSLYSFIPSRAE